VEGEICKARRGLCWCVLWRKRKAHFIPDKAKVNLKLYCEILLPRLVEDCNSILPSGFSFQQDGARAHTAKLAKN